MIRFLKLLWCGLFGHKLVLLRIYSDVDCERLYCPRCKGEWGHNKRLKEMILEMKRKGMNTDEIGEISCIRKWDKELAAIHQDPETAEEIIKKYGYTKK